MFGRRNNDQEAPRRSQSQPASGLQSAVPAAKAPPPSATPIARQEPIEPQRRHSEEYYDVKTTVFNALIDTIDLTQLAKLDSAAAREEIRDIVSEIIQIKNVVMSIAEQEELLEDICNDVLGYGPLEPLLARDDIADIMVNGAGTTFIEVNGKMIKTSLRFADNQQLMNICQRIVSQVGRRVDESSPICDARLPDGSRVNVIAPPLAIDGPALTIRKFKKDRLTLDHLARFGSITQQAKTVLEVVGRVRCNVLISGGTGSGKTTLLNCLTGCIDHDERIITCEDSAELQLQQPHVVRLETRPPNLEGEGEINMRDLVKNCLRMRPERIIVGEVRGPEAFDLLQAMNTGHDGSMGTLHSNSPREALSRLESMIMMGGFALPIKTIREMIVGSIDVIIQASRLRDGSRKVTHITEVVGMEDDTITLQNLIVYEILGEDTNGKLIGRHRSTGIARPAFWERATYYKEDGRLAAALAAAEVLDQNGNHLERPMDDAVSLQLLTALIAAVAVMALAYALIYPMLAPEPLEQRLNAVRDSKKQDARSPLESAAARRRQVSETLKDIEGRNKSSEKVTLRQSLERAGLGSDPKAFFLASAAAGAAAVLLIMMFAPASGMKYVYVALGGFAAGFGLPRFVLSKLITRRQNKFLDELANALDIIVRGVKSGLPLNDCLQIIANESPEPISGEFREVIEQQRVGVPLGEALERMTMRVPLQEAKFFAIVVAIQQQAGGNLAEALNNLSGVLRDRVRMKTKVQALSSEAKASAMILGSLPPGVMAMLWLSTPDYVAPLITTKAGNLFILGGLFWMGLGILMMRKMINFKF